MEKAHGPEPSAPSGDHANVAGARADRSSRSAGDSASQSSAGTSTGPVLSAATDRLLALQRTAGNAAVAQLLASSSPAHRQPAPIQPVHIQRQPTRAELLEQYEQDVAAARWAHAAELLNGCSDADIQSRAAALSPAQRSSMRAACQEWNHRVRRALLDLDFKAAVAAGDWPNAANLLNAFNDSDITARVNGLSRPQRISLYVTAPARITAIITTADPEAAYQGDVRKADWPTAAVHLATFTDAEIATRAAALTPAQRASMRAACAPDNHRVRRPLLDLDFKAAIAAGDWPTAANLLNAFNDPDITTRLQALPSAQRISLYVAANIRIGDIIAGIDRESAYQGDLRKSDWTRAALHLAGFSDAEIATRVAALTPAQRASMRAACAPDNHRVRRALLDLDFKAAVAAGDWPNAANLLNAFNDPDITTRVRALPPAQRIELYVAANVRIGDIVAAADLSSAFQGDLRKSDWARAVIHLNGFSDADIATRIAALTPAQRSSMLAACTPPFSRIRIALIGRPTRSYLVPFDRAPLAAAGERIIFNGRYAHAAPAQFQLVFSSAGGGFGSPGGPATQTIPGLTSGNVDFLINSTWTGATATTVQLQVQLTDGTVVSTENWTFGFKSGATPTTMVQLETEGERPLPSAYTYQLGPDIGSPGQPDYEHQTILERFGGRTCNITLADLKPGYAAANSLTTQADVTAHFFGSSSNNGTFTVDAHDRVYDQHTGMQSQAMFIQALTTMKEITVDLPQIYEVVPGVPLARFIVRRILKLDGSTRLRKMRAP